jgi:hypothetical protein
MLHAKSEALGLMAVFILSPLVVGATACGSNAAGGSPEPERYLGLAMPANGFQLRSIGAEIGPGEEHEYCEIVQIPGAVTDEYYVSSLELANAESSHHFGLAIAPSGTLAALELERLGVGNRIECPGPGLAFGEGIDVIATIQHEYGIASLPPGVARRHRGGDLVVFDYHYANAGVQPIQARSAVNFHLIDGASVQHLAQGFGLSDVTIDIAPRQTASVTGECHFGTDMLVGAFTRHTHKWGTEFSVWHSGGTRDGEHIWTSLDWRHEIEFTFPEPVLVRAGEGFRYRCTYANDTTRRLRFGATASDEMCMLYGPAWPAQSGETLEQSYCNVSWVDESGIGHPAHEAGGFPKPNSADVALCSALAPVLDSCGSCLCNSCAAPALRCAQDPDCLPLLACFIACTDPACTQACHARIRNHSSGAGFLVSAGECLKVECPICLPGAQ